jgi:hypothetical protein
MASPRASIAKAIDNMEGVPGQTLELNGPMFARLAPIASAEEAHSDDKEWTDAKNERRCELIDRKYEGALSRAEET